MFLSETIIIHVYGNTNLNAYLLYAVVKLYLPRPKYLIIKDLDCGIIVYLFISLFTRIPDVSRCVLILILSVMTEFSLLLLWIFIPNYYQTVSKARVELNLC